MKLSPERIEEIRIAAKQFAIVFGVFALFLYIASRILYIWEDSEECLMWAFISLYTSGGCLFFCIISLYVMWEMDQKKKDDKNKQRIDELEATVQELQAKREQARKESPLTNLTDEQQTAIEDFLMEMTTIKTNGEAINMKEWARFIRALEDMGYISVAKSADFPGIRKWVITLVGEKCVPNSSAFNQAIRNATQANIDDAKDKLEKILKLN